MAWSLDEFAAGLTSVSEATVRAYRTDLAAFVEWCGRLGLDGPEQVDRRTLRRYLAYLSTRKLARRSVARKATSLRRYFGWLTRTGRIPVDPTAGLSAPKGEGRLPHVLRDDQLHTLLDDPEAVARSEPARKVDDRRALALRQRDDAVLEVLYGSGLRVVRAVRAARRRRRPAGSAR